MGDYCSPTKAMEPDQEVEGAVVCEVTRGQPVFFQAPATHSSRIILFKLYRVLAASISVLPARYLSPHEGGSREQR